MHHIIDSYAHWESALMFVNVCFQSLLFACFKITRSARSTVLLVLEQCKCRDDDSCVYSKAFFIAS